MISCLSYQVLSNEDEHPPKAPPTPTDTDAQIASFYLPKDTTKVIHIGRYVTAYYNSHTMNVLDVFSNKFCCILSNFCLSPHSDTSTQQVIELLLSKFKITDNPKKFALYEKIEDEKGVTSYTHIVLNFVEGFEWFLVFFSVMRKMCPDEQPLPLCLSWGSQGLESHKFVLHENDSGDVIVS